MAPFRLAEQSLDHRLARSKYSPSLFRLPELLGLFTDIELATLLNLLNEDYLLELLQIAWLRGKGMERVNRLAINPTSVTRHSQRRNSNMSLVAASQDWLKKP
jgi:hypothetical protein